MGSDREKGDKNRQRDEGRKGREQNKPTKRIGGKTMRVKKIPGETEGDLESRAMTDTVLMWVWSLLQPCQLKQTTERTPRGQRGV